MNRITVQPYVIKMRVLPARRISLTVLLALLIAATLLAFVIVKREPPKKTSSSIDISTPAIALDAIVSALKAGDTEAIKRVTTAKGLQTVSPDPQMPLAYHPQYYRDLGEKIDRIKKRGLSEMDASHVGGDALFRGGSGRYTDRLILEKTGTGWKLDEYTRIWDRYNF
jgi:hypothetical protein